MAAGMHECVCESVIWDSCRGRGGCSIIFLRQRKKGVCPCTRLAQWTDSSVSDITTSYLTYLKWPWRHCCLFHSVSVFSPSPSSLSYTTPFSASFPLSSFSRFPIHIFLFFFFHSYRGNHTWIEFNWRETRRGKRAKRQNRQALPITQFRQIKTTSMNINVLESSTGPGDMTKWEDKLPPYGQKSSVGPLKERFSAGTGGMFVDVVV